MRWSGQLARWTIAAGQSAPRTGTSASQTARRLWIERWIASVAPEAPRARSSSPSGIGELLVLVRVRMTVWLTPGSVSSRPSAAAAAA